MESDWILSRKLAYKSLTRHFAGWKMRQFVLDSIQKKLEIRTPENSKVTIIQFNVPSIAIGRHYYSADSNHLLWIRYFDVEEHCPKEVIMKFGDRDSFDTWEKKLTSLLDQYKAHLQEKSMVYIDALACFLKEKSHCQSLLQEDLETTAEYYERQEDMWNDDDDSAIETMDDDFLAKRQDEEFPEESSHDEEDLALKRRNYNSSQKQEENFAPPFNQSHRKALRGLTVPHMNILIMAVGTRGDIQPFTQLGMRLRQDGHRVRIATHAMFRDYVITKGLEFYPLAGDPVVLSEFMVKTQGFIIPTTPEMLMEAPKHHAMIVEIIHSCWGACIYPDPMDEQSRPFAADVIISNPVTYAHAHCAEALGIPLHLMFPQPWTPTKAFPHPLSCLSYHRSWCAENHMSYQVIERTMWLSFEREINKFRSSVGLEPLRTGQGGWNMLNYHRIPFVKMWSPSLVPKPKDWEDHVDVVGTFMEPIPIVNPKLIPSISFKAAKRKMNTSYDPRVRKMKTEDSVLPVAVANYEPAPELAEFLDTEEPIIFVGFGSMVVKDLKSILSLFLEAAALANVKILIQVGWSSISPETFMELALEAQSKAALVRETEAVNLGESIIFPSSRVDEKMSRDDDSHDILTRLEAGASSSVSIIDNPTKLESEQAKSAFGSWFAGALTLGSKFTSTVAESIVNLSQQSTDRASNTVGSNQTTNAAKGNLQHDWDEVENDGWTAAKDAFFMGPCPHNWLFQKVFAVVHHGGAGTTASGLRFGCPTWICPFFGDQYFWGEMVSRANLGPPPCPIHQLTLPLVVEAFEKLKDQQLKENALKMSAHMASEDGVEAAVSAFYRHLPLENMLCDVSLFHGEYTLAQEYCVDCGLKMSAKVSQAIHGDASLHLQGHKIMPCCYFDWSAPTPSGATEGIVQGVGSLVHEMVSGVTGAVQDPVKGIYNDGLQGAVTGVVSGLNTLVHHQITGGSLLYEKLKEGVLKSYRVEDEGHSGDDLTLNKLTNTSRKPLRIINHSCSESNLLLRQKRAYISVSSTFPHGSMKSLTESCMSAMTDENVSNPASPMIYSSTSSSKRYNRPGYLSHSPSKLDTSFGSAHDGLEGLRAPPNILSPIKEEDSPSVIVSSTVQQSRASPSASIPEVTRESTGNDNQLSCANSIHLYNDGNNEFSNMIDLSNDLFLQLDGNQELSQSCNYMSTSRPCNSIFINELPGNPLLEELTKSMINPEVRSLDHYDDFESESVITNTFSHSDTLLESQIMGKSHKKEVHSSCHSVSHTVLTESFKAAQESYRLFKLVGASNGRFICEKTFISLMQKVITRSQALLNDEEIVTSLFQDLDAEEKEAMLQNSLKILGRNKKHIDFVNFALFLIHFVNNQPVVNH